MKLETQDLEKIGLIVRDAAIASEAPFFLLALKKEDSPQYEIKFVYPDNFNRFKTKELLPTINLFIDSVYRSQNAAFAADLQEGFKSIIARDEIAEAARQFRVTSAGLCPVIFEIEIVGWLFFMAKEDNQRTLKVVDSFAKQIAAYLSIKEYQRITRDAVIKSQTLIEASQDAFFTIDTQSSHIHVGPSLREMTGYSPEEFMQVLISPEKYVIAEDLPKVKDFYRDSFAGKKVEVEFRLQRKDGNTMWFSIISHPVFDSAGKLIAIQGVGRDISENKKATWELE